MLKRSRIFLFFFCMTATQYVLALTFPLPNGGSTVVGKIQAMQTITGDSIVSLARRYDMGITELLEANPDAHLDQIYHPQQVFILPSQFILPNAPHRGIVINLAELRLYFYDLQKKEVITFPIGIGRQGWESPLGTTSILRKKADPTWRPTQHILQARLKDGVVLPKKVPPGPANPLGPYALYTAIPTILIHGSNDPSGVGRRSSSACFRLQPEAIESLYPLVPIGSPVTIVNQPIKIGWLGNDLYLEIHIPLEDQLIQHPEQLQEKMHQLVKKTIAKKQVKVDWSTADKAVIEQRGYPVKIGFMRNL